MNPTISARHADPYENAWVYDNPPFGLGLPRRSVVAELFLAIYDISRDGEGTWDVGVAEMSRIFNCAPRSIRRALSVLTARHLVRAVDTFIPAGKCARSKVTRYAVSMERIGELQPLNRSPDVERAKSLAAVGKDQQGLAMVGGGYRGGMLTGGGVRSRSAARKDKRRHTGMCDDEWAARTLDRMSPRYGGKRIRELTEAVSCVREAIGRGCTGGEIVEAYRWYLDEGGSLTYALPWLRGTETDGMDCALWCVTHLRHS
jgi:hypothetical protein